jgi:hypothetical protein
VFEFNVGMGSVIKGTRPPDPFRMVLNNTRFNARVNTRC